MKNISDLKQKADLLFEVFQQKYFKNSGNYPRRTNLVLEFFDFIQNSSQQDLEQYITFNSQTEFCDLKDLINQGIDCWLDAGDLKTFFISDVNDARNSV